MTTTGTTTFNPTLQQLVTQSYRDLDIIDAEESPTGAQFTEAMFLLNSITKGLEATGIHVWTEQEAILFLQPGQARYTLGSSGVNDNCPSSDSWLQLTLGLSAIAGANAITLAAAADVNVGDNIGIVLDAGPTFWTTVLQQIPAAPALATSVVLAAPLPSSASSGNIALDYAPAAQIVRPLKIPRMRLFTFSSQTEIPMMVLSRQEYMDLPNKGQQGGVTGPNTGAQGTPTQFFYSPQRDLGWAYIWPVPNLSRWAARFTWYRPIQDWANPANTMDFPARMVRAAALDAVGRAQARLLDPAGAGADDHRQGRRLAHHRVRLGSRERSGPVRHGLLVQVAPRCRRSSSPSSPPSQPRRRSSALSCSSSTASVEGARIRMPESQSPIFGAPGMDLFLDRAGTSANPAERGISTAWRTSCKDNHALFGQQYGGRDRLWRPASWATGPSACRTTASEAMHAWSTAHKATSTRRRTACSRSPTRPSIPPTPSTTWTAISNSTGWGPMSGSCPRSLMARASTASTSQAPSLCLAS